MVTHVQGKVAKHGETAAVPGTGEGNAGVTLWRRNPPEFWSKKAVN